MLNQFVSSMSAFQYHQTHAFCVWRKNSLDQISPWWWCHPSTLRQLTFSSVFTLMLPNQARYTFIQIPGTQSYKNDLPKHGRYNLKYFCFKDCILLKCWENQEELYLNSISFRKEKDYKKLMHLVSTPCEVEVLYKWME